MSGLVGMNKVVPPLLLFFAGGYVLDYFIVHGRVLGGKTLSDMHTFKGSHKEAERERFLNMERQGAPDEPVIMNPMRHNIPAHIRNAADLANLSLDS